MSKIETAETLENRSLQELRSLFCKAHDDLVASEAESPERRTALASMENIGRAIAKRMALPTP